MFCFSLSVYHLLFLLFLWLVVYLKTPFIHKWKNGHHRASSGLYKTYPSFPQPYLIEGRINRIKEDLEKWLRHQAQAAFPEDMGSIPCNHSVGASELSVAPVAGALVPSAGL